MENATDALKMAFAVLVLVMALTIAITMFSQLNRVSKILISSTDITNYYQYNLADSSLKFREVGLETIIPTLYKYYKENYTVVFLQENSSTKKTEPFYLYESQVPTEIWGKGAGDSIGKYTIVDDDDEYTLDDGIFTFDVDEEVLRHEPWTSSPEEYKKNIDCFLNGTPYRYFSSSSSRNNWGRW